MTGYRTLALVPSLGQKGSVPLTERPVKGKSTTWFAFGNNPFYGQQIPALAKELPTTVEYEGQQFNLTKGTTPDGRAKVSGTGPILFDAAANEHRNLTVTISVTKTGAWNVVAKVVRQGGGSGDRVQDLDDLWASIQ